MSKYKGSVYPILKCPNLEGDSVEFMIKFIESIVLLLMSLLKYPSVRGESAKFKVS